MQNNKIVVGIVLVVGLVVGYAVSSLLGTNMKGDKGIQITEIPGGPGAKATDIEKPKLPDLSELKKSKITLVDALKQVEAKYSPAIEAKFETADSGKLSLSIYPVGKDINTDAARNVFQELAGDPTVVPWNPDLATFTDEEHLKGSARDLTIVQTAGLTLREAVEKVNETQPGFVYWSLPTIRDGHPGYGVYTLDSSNTSHYFFVTAFDSTAYGSEKMGAANQNSAASPAGRYCGSAIPVYNFDSDALGALPSGFLSARTGPGQDGVWKVLNDSTAPSGQQVLAQTSADSTDGRFPIAVATGKQYQDFELGVKFKPVSGKVDQAGGLVFRYQDANNYYLVRANALENNFRLYHVVGGVRVQFAGASTKVTANTWHALRVVMVANRIQAFFDGQKLIDAADNTFSSAGLVGVWTKADSVTYFDDLAVKEASAMP